MTYGDWIGVETRRECERETITKKLKRGCTPAWIHEVDKFPMELIREVQTCMESGNGEIHKEPRGRNTVIEKVSEGNSTLYNHMIRLEAYRQDYIDAVRREYARKRIAVKLLEGRTPAWIHEEDEYPMELILEVQADLESENHNFVRRGLL